MNNLLIVIIPAFNESKGIIPTLDKLHQLKPQLNSQGLELKIYVVDDGSQDDTYQVAKVNGADRILRHRINLGLGAAVRSGLNAARNDGAFIAVKMDADLQHEPSDILELIKPILNDEAEIVYGNRFKKIDYSMPPIRKIGNAIFTTLMRWLTKWPLEDSQPGIFAVHNSYLKKFRISGSYNYTQQILLDAYHKGTRFAHVPVSFHKRTSGKSFVSYKYPFVVGYQIIMTLAGLRPMRVFVPIGMIFLGAASLIGFHELFQWANGAASKPIVHVNAVLGMSLFGLQTLFFGVLAELIIRNQSSE
jgi:glycosyltransferase involved in cell wall biosynthesis